MSNKKETPVSWLMEAITYDNGYGERCASFRETFDLFEYFDKALQMESQKQQKYDEMLAMLEGILKICDDGYIEAYEGDFGAWETELNVQMEEARQLVKGAKEL
jgi:hypothetical protein